MPYHSPPPKTQKGLTESQKKKLKEAEKHHSKKHMDLMKKLMKGGMSFTKAHNEATKKVGK